ncbi:uncharacterized protein LOC124939739 [Impatiens glandulifera]|uniref:uncharacterized protein LOC124939739 n=1 Tax=Impatiens glandulifera TaxID=253017 RepID=UPI001FB0DDA8|nr:uncharacterized protein LOC124939739 [Impatiens glandulifera]
MEEVGDTTLKVKGKQPELMLKLLTYTDLAKITDNFSEDNYIGDFQFGKLYRGFLDKQHFTVKIWITSKLRDIVLGFRERNLMDELIMLSHQRLVHPCIVGLYGYCRDKENIAVVYNLKSMDSLENILLKDDFTWLQRMKVAFDLACLLAFLHAKRGDLDPFVIRNLSPEHVILDEEYNPKLVDFSMITGGFFPDRQVYSIQPAYGCNGYRDPNLFHDNPLAHLATWTSKSDVFAFGLILVSLLSKGAEEMESDMTHSLAEWAYRKYKFDKSIIHKSLERDIGFSYVDGEALSKLAVCCVSKGRPSMMKVVDRFLKLHVFNDHKHKKLLSVDRYMKKKKRHPSVSLDHMRKNKLLLNTEIDYFSCDDDKDIERMDSDALKRYTNNFSEDNYIGRFQFGKIFRGLPEISDKGPLFVTVKIWDDYEDLQHNLLRLGDEILLLHHEKYTCHSGMVRMYGYCIEDKYVAIVIFLKPMNSIRNLLPRGDFSWLHRIKAAWGVASLLKFLHDDVSRLMDPFIIRNLDSAHILLDEEYNPKLVDFGLISGGIFPNRPMYMVKSNLKCHDQVLPAYDISGSWTTKSDVYSFGVLLLCLISKRNIVKPDDGGLPTSEDMENIHVHKSLQTDSTYNCLDGQEIKRLAVQCVQINPAYRPSMSEIVDALQNLKVVKSNTEFVGLDKISRVNYATNYSNMPKSHWMTN